ncbi:hypothetical protein DL98DRAFT_589946 [Cadophora sp. DSE1049]|nr:hypothetical protein DL98DRAFT_589946 [Cadophora sp. DSE1049]
MGLSVGHHIRSQMGLSCPLHSFMPTSTKYNSNSVSKKHKPITLTISKFIYNISIRKWLRNRRDWREKVAGGSAEVSELPKDSKSKYDNKLQHQMSLSLRQFSCWELAWHLAISESHIAHIKAEVRSARMSIGEKDGQISRSKKRFKLDSRVRGRPFDDSITRAGDSLLEELEKLVRQMIVLTKSNANLTKSNVELTKSNAGLKVCLERPALEKNVVVQQIVRQLLSDRANLTDPLCAVGIAIRKRYLENSAYHSRNKEIVLAGNEAAHNGDALADAILYHPNEANHRTDVPTYSKVYGLPPIAVWTHRHCKPFVQLVTWYGTVKRWHPHNFTCTQFAKAWPADFFEKYSKAQPQVVQADFANGKKADLIKVIEAKYSIESKENRSKYQ